MDWFRLYSDITWDHKLRRHSPSIRWAWITVMCIASRSPERGTLLLSDGVPVTVEDIADEAAIPLREAKKAVKLFIEQNMMEEHDSVFVVSHWDKRQFASDDSSQRVKAHRQRKRNNNETLQDRYSNVPETPPDTYTETDSDSEKDSSHPLGVEPHVPEATEKERLALAELKAVEHYPFDYPKDLVFIRDLATDYPELDILEQAKRWRTYKLDRPLQQKKSNPRSQFRNYCDISNRRLKEESGYGTPRASPAFVRGQAKKDTAKPSKYAGLYPICTDE